jgi:predicted heme/steroid binding protein/uncharacterized membrane protein
MKEFTSEELAGGDGKAGHRTLVAVDGKVYDVTDSGMWREGRHVNTHEAGEDLSLGFEAAPHGREVLGRFEQVGTIATAEARPAAREAGPLLAAVLARHPHPPSVHFPIALGFASAVGMALFLVTRHPGFETFALYAMIGAAAVAPVSIASGALSWVYNYSAVWTPIYRGKVTFSVVLVLVQATALVLRLAVAEGPDLGSAAFWGYAVLALAQAPTVLRLGQLGGKITFPT